MTQMEQAMIDAGIKAPSQKERVWRVVKEAGRSGILSKEICARLKNITPNSIGALLNDLASRGMVATTPEFDRGTGRHINRYSTDMDEYRQLPVVVAKAIAVKSPPAPAPAAPAPVAEPAVSGPNIDHLTLAQARALYQQLHKMFGGRV